MQRVFVLFTALLASTVLLKVSSIQYLEILYSIQMLVLLVALERNGWTFSIYKPFAVLGLLYLAVLVLSMGLAIWALRGDFYPAADLNPLKYPFVISALRASELLASVFALLYLAHLFRKEESETRLAMRVYFHTGVVSALYSILTYPLARANLIYLGTSPDYRMRGFYNEGGPYGLYLISVILVGAALYQLEWERRVRLQWEYLLLFLAFVGSQSKAAVVALVIMGIVNLLLSRSTAQRISVLGSTIIILSIVSQVVDVTAGIRLYRQASLAYERASYLHREDTSFVLGRVAGAFLVPRMLAAHPLAGIGWGNYGLVRNAPEYRGASAWVDINDDPGLGLFGLAAELGIPLTALLCWGLLLPSIYLRRRRVPVWLMNMALLQPIAHIFGAQLNLTYPWIISAFALGLGLQPNQERLHVGRKTLRPKLVHQEGV